MKLITNNLIHYSYPVQRDMKSAELSATIIADEILKLKWSEINLVYRGSSGSTIALLVYSRISQKMKVSMTYLHKQGESSHDSAYVDANDSSPIAIIDDFINSGRTLREIGQALHNFSPTDDAVIKKVKLLAICRYSEHKDWIYELYPNLEIVIDKYSNWNLRI